MNRGAGESRFEVMWRTDRYGYDVNLFGFTEQQAASLVNRLDVSDGEFSVQRWPDLDDFEVARVQPLPEDGVTHSWILNSKVPDGVEVPLSLEVQESSLPLLMYAEFGDTIVDVQGQPGLQSRNGAVTWKPNRESVAWVYGSLSPTELLSIAQTVKQESADQFERISAF